MTAYESARSERVSFEGSAAREVIRIRPPKPGLTVAFVFLWLCLWTVGGGFALTQLFSEKPQGASWFLVFWLCLWVLGWISAASSIVWSLFGSETVRVLGRDLEVGYAAAGFSRRKSYRGDDIHHVSVAPALVATDNHSSRSNLGTAINGTGRVQFRYGERMVSFGAGLDDAEAQIVVDRLRARLPRAASEA